MLQSSFFGGPRGKDFLITKIFPNAVEAKNDISGSNITDVKPDDYIMISYGVLSDDTDSEYIANLNKDSKINYNAKIYQKIIKNKNTVISNNDLDGDNYIYKFIIDLSSQLKINFNDDEAAGGAYNLSYDENVQEYNLNMPKPVINYDTENRKLKIILNGETFETEVANKIIDNSTNIAIAKKFSLVFSGENFDSGFETALNANTVFIPEEEKWYLFDCKFTDTSNSISYWTVFAYAYQSKTTDTSNSDCIVYSKVSGNAGSSLPNYIVPDGVMVKNDIKQQKTFIENSSGLIYTGNIDGEKIVLPGQIVQYDDIPDTNLYISAGNNLYYKPSPLEESLYNKIKPLETLYNKIESLETQMQNLEKESSSLIKTIDIIFWQVATDSNGNPYPTNLSPDGDNFYQRTTKSNTGVDVFSKTGINCINSNYLTKYSGGQANLYDLTAGLNLIEDSLKDYNKLILTFNYEINPNITEDFYLSLVNINTTRKERITTLGLLNGFKNFDIILKKKQDGNFYISLSNLEESWKDTFYYETDLTENAYTSSSVLNTAIKMPLFVNNNYLYLSLSLSNGNTQSADSISSGESKYYRNFIKYFNSLSVTLKGYKD